MKIFFYNHWHNGDIHNSRSFIKEIVDKNPQHDFTYLHYNSNKLLLDIKNLKYQNLKNFQLLDCLEKPNCYHDIKEAISEKEVQQIPQPWGGNFKKLPVFIKNDACFINTWIGSYPLKENIYDRYITAFQRIFEFFNMDFDPNKNWCPDIDFSVFSSDKIQNFINSKIKTRILVCNGTSLQADDFSFKIPLERLLKEFDLELILTSKKDQINGAKYTEDITDCPFNDLNEISLISTSCDIIVGRSSGPLSYCIVKKNQLNPNKIFVNFINIDEHENFNLGESLEPKRGPFFLKHSKAKFLFSNSFSQDSIYSNIKKAYENITSNNTR